MECCNHPLAVTDQQIVSGVWVKSQPSTPMLFSYYQIHHFVYAPLTPYQLMVAHPPEIVIEDDHLQC